MKSITLIGEVVRGDGMGRRLGFPTANIKLAKNDFPPFGVYRVKVYGPGLKGRLAVCNVGIRPTLDGSQPQVEVHVPKFSADLYGKRLKVVILGKIRDEMKFPSLDELKVQIQHDVMSLKVLHGVI